MCHHLSKLDKVYAMIAVESTGAEKIVQICMIFVRSAHIPLRDYSYKNIDGTKVF